MGALRKLADIVQLGKNADVGALVDALLDLVQEKQEEAPDALGQLLSEIILSAYPKLSPETRRSVAERTGPSMLLSKPLALRLATDDIEIARPVLRASPVLSDHDLIDLVPDLGTEHLQEIAARQTLGTDLQGIIDKRAVSSKPEAGLDCPDLLFVDPSGSVAVSEGPIVQSEVDSGSIDETDMAPDTEGEADGFDCDGPDTVPAFVPEQPASEPVEEDPGVLALVDAVRARRLTASDALRRLCSESRQDRVASLLGHLCNMPQMAALPILLSADDQLLAAACRTIDVDMAAYKLLADWRGDHLQLTSMERRHALLRYKALSQKRALTVLNQKRAFR